jgi:hypothetical protein
MRHKSDYDPAAEAAYGLPSPFTFHVPVRSCDRVRVREHLDCNFETEAVFRTIASVLTFIPLEARRHVNTF